MMARQIQTSARKSMQGAALPIAMIFLFLITLTGVSMLDTSVDNQKMTNNFHHHSLSNQAADSVLYKLLVVSAEDVGPGYTNAFEATFSSDFQSIADQPDMGVDLSMQYEGERKNVFIPGFEIGSSAYIYTATSTGSVGNASVTNSMGVALIRPPTK